MSPPRAPMASETQLLKAVVVEFQEVLSPVAVNTGNEYKEVRRDHRGRGGMSQSSEHSSLFKFSRIIIYPVPKRTPAIGVRDLTWLWRIVEES